MSQAIEGLEPKLVWKYFAEIARIPRPSKHEEAMTAYVMFGVRLEERDLVADHPEYEEYRRRVPMFIPGLKGAGATESDLTAGAKA